MAFNDLTGDDVSSALHPFFLALASGTSDNPLGNLPQTMALTAQQQRSGTSRAALKALLIQEGATPEQAEQYSANERIASLALDSLRNTKYDAVAKGIFGGAPAGAAGAAQAPSVAPPAPRGPASGASLNGSGIGGFVDAVVSQESGGNPTARNPNSTATGAGQFTTGTWQGLMRSRPDLGLTPDGRTDPEQSRKAIQALAEENAPQLAGSGHEVNPANLYMGHFLGGAGGVRFLNGLRQNPNAPATSYVDPGAASANRTVFFKPDGSPRTAQEVYALQTRKFQGLSPTQTADASGRIDAPAAINDGTAIQTEAGPVPFTPSVTPGPTGPSAVASAADTPLPGARAVSTRPDGIVVPPAPASAPTRTEQARAIFERNQLQRQLEENERKIVALAPGGDRYKGMVDVLKQRNEDLRKRLDTVDKVPDGFERDPENPGRLRPVAGGPQSSDYLRERSAATAKENTRVTEEINQRREAVIAQGLDPKEPRNEAFILTGRLPKEDQQPLSATDKKAILEADENVLSAQTAMENLRQAKELSKKAFSGPMASKLGYGGSFVGVPGAQETLDLDNLVTTNALSQLKAIFGAAPTEGERKILLDIQGSTALPDAARQKIFDRAIGMAERRMAFSKQRSDELRGGTYYKSGGGDAGTRGQASPAAASAPSAPAPAPAQPEQPQRSQPAMPAAAPPAAAIDYLRRNPRARDQFDAKYGPGASERYLGGGGVL